MSSERMFHRDVEEERTRRILTDPEKTLPALIFSLTGRIVCKITRRKEPLPWQFSLVVLAIVVQLPTLLVSNLLHETEQWVALGFRWMGFIELGLFAMAVARFGIFYLYKNINLYIVDAIQTQDDLKDLQQVLKRAWSLKRAIYFTLVFTFFWSISWSLIFTFYIGQFIGFGLFTGTIIFALLMGPALYIEGWFFFFIIRIGYYSYDLNETSPAHSEVIWRLSRTITTLLYSIAIFIAFGTAMIAFNVWAVVLGILIGWLPTTIYFIGSQISISRIILSAKWNTLDRIQEQIKTFSNGDITDKNNIENINRLMDYHERIRVTPNSTLNIATGFNTIAAAG